MPWEQTFLAASLLLGDSEAEALSALSPQAAENARKLLREGDSKPARAKALAGAIRSVASAFDRMELAWPS
jgi:hypothetical protein